MEHPPDAQPQLCPLPLQKKRKKYFLLTEFKVCIESYGPSFYSVDGVGHKSMGKNEDS